MIVNAAFDDDCYLVGSAVASRDFRDVDVRMIMDDHKYELFFGPIAPAHSALLSLIIASVSGYLSQLTGLRIDFQIQKRSRISKEEWDKPRVSLGRAYRVTLRSSDGTDLRPPWMVKPKWTLRGVRLGGRPGLPADVAPCPPAARGALTAPGAHLLVDPRLVERPLPPGHVVQMPLAQRFALDGPYRLLLPAAPA